MGMRAFVTYDKLRQFGSRVDAQVLLKEASRATGKTVFLSHSSKDHGLLPGVILILQNHGGQVYVDDVDPELSKCDFVETADRLRRAARQCRKLVLLVTPRTGESKWIPWELGLGDGKNAAENVALFPSAESADDQDWADQEYLGLYRRILWANFENKNPEWLVLDHRNNTAKKLRVWLTS